MSRKKISQREARVMKKAIRLAEAELNALRSRINALNNGQSDWTGSFPPAMQLPITVDDRTAGLLEGSARTIDLLDSKRVSVTVLVHPMGNAEVRVLAIKLPQRMSDIMDQARGKGCAS